MYNKALEIARKAHINQFDKGGQPYINHPLAVSEKMPILELKIVALLHDVVEDSNITLQDLINAGFDSEIIDALDCITKRKNESYDQYLLRVSANPLAKKVKIEDLLHNMDTSRLGQVAEKDKQRNEKYAYALEFLRTHN